MIQHIKIPKEELDYMNKVISGKAGLFGENTIAIYTAKFPNGIEADIKVCGVKEADCTPFVDAVIFDDGNELCCLEPCFDALDGRYIFQVDDVEYIVAIIPEELEVSKVTIVGYDDDPQRLHIEMNNGEVYFIDSELIPDLAEMGNKMA